MILLYVLSICEWSEIFPPFCQGYLRVHDYLCLNSDEFGITIISDRSHLGTFHTHPAFVTAGEVIADQS